MNAQECKERNWNYWVGKVKEYDSTLRVAWIGRDVGVVGIGGSLSWISYKDLEPTVSNLS